jgi:hypothetical protein
MTGKYGASNVQTTVLSTSTCGGTGYSYSKVGSIQTIINSSVYDLCHYHVPTVNDTTPNPSIGQVAAHEAGHAYDFAIASLGQTNRGNAISLSAAFQSLLNYDVNNLSTTGNANFKTCAVFDSQAPSGYEIQLGSTYASAVCTGNTLNDPPYTASQSNTAILKLEAPYFVNPAAAIQFEDVFAENFATYNGPGSVLPFYDRLIGQSPAGLVCSSTVLYALQVMGELPNAAAIQYPQGCPTPTDAELSPNVP